MVDDYTQGSSVNIPSIPTFSRRSGSSDSPEYMSCISGSPSSRPPSSSSFELPNNSSFESPTTPLDSSNSPSNYPSRPSNIHLSRVYSVQTRLPEQSIGEDLISSTYPISANIFVETNLPKVGRCLWNRKPALYTPFHCATGGVVLKAGGGYYQLTVNHLCLEEMESSSSEGPLQEGLQECHFDGQSDEDDSGGDETESEVEITALGSLTPRSTNSIDEDTSSGSSPASNHINDGGLETLLEGDTGELPEVESLHAQNQFLLQESCEIRGREGPRAILDYALIRIERESVAALGDGLNKVHTPNPICIYKISKISSEEKRIVAITSSTGPVHGILIPGGISYRQRATSSFQRIYQVKLEAVPKKGDCGSAVVDKDTGNLYGHIILGDTTTGLAYILPAVDIVKDISRSLKTAVILATTGHYFPSEFWERSGCNEIFHVDDIDELCKHLLSVHLGGICPPRLGCWFCPQQFVGEIYDHMNCTLNIKRRMLHIRGHILAHVMTKEDVKSRMRWDAHLTRRLVTNLRMYGAHEHQLGM